MSDEGSSLFLCPHCGAFVSESSSKCPNCGNVLEGSDDESLELELEELQIEEQEDIIDIENPFQKFTRSSSEIPDNQSPPSHDGEEAVTLFLCSVCGAFTASGAENCSQCGASMVDEDDESVPQIQPDELEHSVLDMLIEAAPDDDFEDLESGSLNSELDLMESDALQDDDAFLLENLKNIESAEDVMNFVESLPDDYDDDLELELTPPKEVLPERSEESDDLLSQLVYLSENIDDDSDERSTAINAVENLLSEESLVQKDDDTIAMCYSCGAFVSESATVCNVCGNSLGGDKKYIPKPEILVESLEEEQADSIIRSLLGVAKDAVLDDEEDRFQADGSLGLCTVCGAFISGDADACTVCGTHMEDMPEFMPSMDIEDKLTDNKALALCPHCGVFVQEGATECMSCIKPIPEGAKLELVEIEEYRPDSDDALNRLRNFLGIEKSLEMEPIRDPSMSGLDICSDCGAFVSLNAVSCSVCGNSLFEGAPIIPSEKMECPNCGSRVASDSPECPLCGMVFGIEEFPELDGPGQDITDILEKELEESIKRLEEKAGVILPEIELDEQTPVEPELWADDNLEELEIEASESDDDISSMLDYEDEPIVPIPVDGYVDSNFEDEIIEIDESLKQDINFIEPLEFIDDEPEEIIEDDETEYEDYIEEDIVEEIPIDRDLSRFDTDSTPHSKPANWGSGIYVSSLALCLTVIFYMIGPGDYAQGLTVVFGTFSLIGIYLLFTEKGIFFKGDFKHASVFISGCLLAVWILVHWPMGILVSYSGFLSQPILDNISLSISILLISVGILWIRARIRYIFTWLSGVFLLFLASAMEVFYSGWANSSISPSLLISGLGGGLVFLSLAFFMYERALNTSIESDIVRGDAHYLKHDYRGAMASYDDAISKAQIKRVEVLGSPLIEYDVPWYSKGSALILMGEYEEGIKSLDMALAINPNNEVTWVNKGNAHSKLGEHDVAQECYERSISVNPFYEIAWNNLGNVMARKKEYVEALKHYNRALKINPRYDDAWINKGYVLAKMGKKEQAVKCLSRVGSRAKVDLPGTETEITPASKA